MTTSGYSGTPLPKKLGIKSGMNLLFVGLPDNLAFLTKMDDLRAVDVGWPGEASARYDMVHLFETDREALAERAAALRTLIRDDGMIWVSWPKQSSKVPTSITEDVLRELLLPIGLVDVKVCAVDEIWSGLKFVIRKELRHHAD